MAPSDGNESPEASRGADAEPGEPVRVLVLRTAGTNCDDETAHAFELAGATAERVHVGALVRGARRLDEFDIVAVPGGFSYGDDLGAGTVLANELRCRLAADLDAFVDSGKLVLGICNGFQVLVRLGILPGWDDEKGASLVENVSGKFEDRWVRLRVEAARCPFLDPSLNGPGRTGNPAIAELPVAHREGRFVLRDPALLERLQSNGQVALTYCRRGTDERAEGRYPDNPNGSVEDIAGITNEAGNVLGLMPHPERFVNALQAPRWTREVPAGALEDRESVWRGGDGYPFFSRAVRFALERQGKSR